MSDEIRNDSKLHDQGADTLRSQEALLVGQGPGDTRLPYVPPQVETIEARLLAVLSSQCDFTVTPA